MVSFDQRKRTIHSKQKKQFKPKKNTSYIKQSDERQFDTHHARIRNNIYNNQKAKCPYVSQCGACQLLNLKYEQQLKKKQRYLNQLLKAYGKVEPIVGMESPYFYRNKVHAVFKKEQHGKIKAGTYQEGTHKVVQIHQCLLEDEKASAIIETIYELVKSFKYTIFDEDTTQGFFRHVLVRVGKVTGEILVVLVTGTLDFPSKKHFVNALLKEHPEITSIVQNINSSRTNMILGEREKILFGKGYIEDVLCECRFKISAKSFYQINSVQTEKLYQKAIALADLRGEETIVDAYCGIGTIGIIASKQCQKVLGVELNKAAIQDAVINAQNNNVTDIQLVAADASNWMLEQADKAAAIDVVFMDPPRTGSDRRFMDALIELAPQKVIYISCNPETLKRDLAYLTRKAYKVEKIIPVDMFPHTVHLETIVKMSRLENQMQPIYNDYR